MARAEWLRRPWARVLMLVVLAVLLLAVGVAAGVGGADGGDTMAVSGA